jgi:Protein of unknown function (DUF1761)
MDLNFLVIIATAIIPLLVGMVWYNPKVFGNTHLREARITDEMSKSTNIGKVSLISLLVAVFAAGGLVSNVIHQTAIGQIMAHDAVALADPNSEASALLAQFVARYGNSFRSFPHGMLHGVLCALFFALPIVTVSALWERRSWKYVAIVTGYWIVCFGLMGGVIAAFA